MTSLKNAECQRLRAELRDSGAKMDEVQRVVNARLAALPLPPRALSPDDVLNHVLGATSDVAPLVGDGTYLNGAPDDAAEEARSEAEAT